jgi:hypothetical protein
MPLDNTTAAQRISDNILSADDGILAISIMDIKGNILAAKSKQSFKETFGLTSDGEKYGGILAIATLSLVNELKNIVGDAQAIITIHDNCKLMLLPMPSYRLLDLYFSVQLMQKTIISPTELKHYWQLINDISIY